MIYKKLRPMCEEAAELGGGTVKDIDIDFTPAKTTAGSMVSDAEAIKGELGKINNAVSTLSSMWQSKKATEAMNTCQEFTDMFDGFYRLIASTPEKINAAAKGLENAENSESAGSTAGPNRGNYTIN